MEEAERRMRSEGLEVVDPRGGRLGSDGQFLGTVSSIEELRNPTGRPESFAPPFGQAGGSFWKRGWWTSSST